MITLDSVSKSYAKGQPAVNNVSLHIEKGEFVFIVGNSGSGKSTLIKLLLKELEPTSGTIKVNGQILNKMKRWRVPKYRRGVGVVFQDFRLLKDRNVYENVAFAQRVIEKPNRVIKKRVPEVLTLVGLAEKYKSFPKELSGGEQQRVAVARAIVNRPDILLADEPTGNVDSDIAVKLMKLFMQQKKTIAVVVDEFGGTSGIVSLEDLVEEIFGDIEDEHDNTSYISKQIDEREYVLSARLEIEKVNETFGLDLPESDDYLTVGGLILNQYQSFPKLHEVVRVGRYQFKIIKVTATKIELVRLKVLE